jgi:hypothetical protein
MQSTLPPNNIVRGAKHRPFAARPQRVPELLPRPRRTQQSSRFLAGYSDRRGRRREIVSLPGAAGSMLVVDRDAATRRDARLLAHLAPDEPAENASLVCSQFIGDALGRGGRCRTLTPQDLSASPFDRDEQEPDPSFSSGEQPAIQLSDAHGSTYALCHMESQTSISQLRWCRREAGQPEGSRRAVSLREAVARLERYEPVQSLTIQALARAEDDPEVSTAVLRAELVRLQESPIVLNRRLREVVLAIVAREELSMSAIAIRCGRIKRNCKGNESGETSWLARRLGLLPDGGRGKPTPWIHSDVLGLIARQGLGLSPREVEI